MFKKPNRFSLVWVVLVLVGVALVVGSALFLWDSRRLVHRVQDARSWVVTPCHIGGRGSQAVRHGRGGTSYDGWVDYTYEFDGRHYISSRFDFLGGLTIHDVDGRNALFTLPTSGDATCFVDPKNPGESVIYRGMPQSAGLDLPLLAVFAGLGILFIGIGWWGQRRALRVVPPHTEEAPPHWDLRNAKLKR